MNYNYLSEVLFDIVSSISESNVKGKTFQVRQILPERSECADITRIYQNSWSHGEIPKLDGGRGEYFFETMNDPRRIFDIVKKVRGSVISRDISSILESCLWYVGNFEGKAVTCGSLIFNKDNESLEKGRGATLWGFQGYGLFGILSQVMKRDWERIGFVVESDTNTMHKITQSNCEHNLELLAVGFLPLKYEIPCAEAWIAHTANDLAGLIYDEKRVSVVKNLWINESHKNSRLVSHVVGDIVPIRDFISEKFHLTGGNVVTPSTEMDTPHGIDYRVADEGVRKVYTVDGDDTCKWLKIRRSSDLNPFSILEYAKENDRRYVEIEVGTKSPSDALEQSRLLKCGFFPTAYLPCYTKNGNHREDTILFSYIVDDDQMNRFVAKTTDSSLHHLVIPEANQIAKTVMQSARRSVVSRK